MKKYDKIVLTAEIDGIRVPGMPHTIKPGCVGYVVDVYWPSGWLRVKVEKERLGTGVGLEYELTVPPSCVRQRLPADLDYRGTLDAAARKRRTATP